MPGHDGPEGGFYSAEDADSEGMEGRFYTWTAEELKAALRPGRCRSCCGSLMCMKTATSRLDETSSAELGSPADAAAVMKIDERDLSRRLRHQGCGC